MNNKHLIDKFISYVKCDSPSKSEGRFCAMLENELLELGFEVNKQYIENSGSDGYNIHAFLPGDGESILFCAHLDTAPNSNNINPILKENFIYSSGDTILGADDKAGVACIMESVEIIVKNKLNHRPIEILFTICEEIGILGSKYADYSKIKSRNAIVLDGTDMEDIVNLLPSNMLLKIDILGKSEPASKLPSSGVHALKAAANAVAKMPCGHIDDITMINIANFLSPGGSNMIADKASFEIEIRSFKEEALIFQMNCIEEILDTECEKLGAKFRIEEIRQAHLVNTGENSNLFLMVKKAFNDLGINANAKRVYGICDAAWLTAHDILAVNIGSGAQNVHTINECLPINDFCLTAKVVLNLMII